MAQHLATAAGRWPALYRFNWAEDHRNFTFNRFAAKTHNLKEAYLLTLYAFDILLPENLEYFGLEAAVNWFLNRHLPLPDSLLKDEIRDIGVKVVLLLEVQPEISRTLLSPRRFE